MTWPVSAGSGPGASPSPLSCAPPPAGDPEQARGVEEQGWKWGASACCHSVSCDFHGATARREEEVSPRCFLGKQRTQCRVVTAGQWLPPQQTSKCPRPHLHTCKVQKLCNTVSGWGCFLCPRLVGPSRGQKVQNYIVSNGPTAILTRKESIHLSGT